MRRGLLRRLWICRTRLQIVGPVHHKPDRVKLLRPLRPVTRFIVPETEVVSADRASASSAEHRWRRFACARLVLSNGRPATPWGAVGENRKSAGVCLLDESAGDWPRGKAVFRLQKYKDGPGCRMRTTFTRARRDWLEPCRPFTRTETDLTNGLVNAPVLGRMAPAALRRSHTSSTDDHPAGPGPEQGLEVWFVRKPLPRCSAGAEIRLLTVLKPWF